MIIVQIKKQPMKIIALSILFYNISPFYCIKKIGCGPDSVKNDDILGNNCEKNHTYGNFVKENASIDIIEKNVSSNNRWSSNSHSKFVFGNKLTIPEVKECISWEKLPAGYKNIIETNDLHKQEVAIFENIHDMNKIGIISKRNTSEKHYFHDVIDSFLKIFFRNMCATYITLYKSKCIEIYTFRSRDEFEYALTNLKSKKMYYGGSLTYSWLFQILGIQKRGISGSYEKLDCNVKVALISDAEISQTDIDFIMRSVDSSQNILGFQGYYKIIYIIDPSKENSKMLNYFNPTHFKTIYLANPCNENTDNRGYYANTTSTDTKYFCAEYVYFADSIKIKIHTNHTSVCLRSIKSRNGSKRLKLKFRNKVSGIVYNIMFSFSHFKLIGVTFNNQAMIIHGKLIENMLIALNVIEKNPKLCLSHLVSRSFFDAPFFFTGLETFHYKWCRGHKKKFYENINTIKARFASPKSFLGFADLFVSKSKKVKDLGTGLESFFGCSGTENIFFEGRSKISNTDIDEKEWVLIISADENHLKDEIYILFTKENGIYCASEKPYSRRYLSEIIFAFMGKFFCEGCVSKI